MTEGAAAEGRRSWQAAFDPRSTWSIVAWGIVGPIVCLSIASRGLGFSPLHDLLPRPEWILPFIVIEIAMIAAWLLARGRLGASQAALGGALFVGAAVALAIGVALLPLSVPTIVFMGLGLLGLVPFATARVFWSSARDAWTRAAARGVPAPTIATLALVGAIVVVAAPIAGASLVERGIRRAAHDLGTYAPDDAAGDVRAITRLSRWPGASLSPVVERYDGLTDETARGRLDDAFREATGETITEFRDRLND